MKVSNFSSLKILHTEWSLGWGGQEIRILAEMKAFREQGVEMALACRPGAKLAEKAMAEGFAVYYLPFSSRIDWRTIHGLAHRVRKEGFQLLHAHSSIDGWCAGLAGKLFGIPVVRSRHLSSPVRRGLHARIVYDWLADAVIASGQHIRDQLLQATKADPAKFFSIPAGADHRVFSPEVNAEAVRSEFALAERWPVIGIVAVLRSWKGHEVLFEACSRLLSEFPRLVLLVVGDGPLRRHLLQRAEALRLQDHVIFAGHREDVAACMKVMDVCVLPSLKNEATSQVMPQAMLVGVPVVCTSAGGLAEVVQDGVTGRVVPPADAQALAEAIRKSISCRNEAMDMARQARASALARFTFAQQIARTKEVYEKVLAANAR